MITFPPVAPQPPQPPEPPPIGGFCEDCGHFAGRHVGLKCHWSERGCECEGLLWLDHRWSIDSGLPVLVTPDAKSWDLPRSAYIATQPGDGPTVRILIYTADGILWIDLPEESWNTFKSRGDAIFDGGEPR